jgi:hypothetical protein
MTKLTEDIALASSTEVRAKLVGAVSVEPMMMEASQPGWSEPASDPTECGGSRPR